MTGFYVIVDQGTRVSSMIFEPDHDKAEAIAAKVRTQDERFKVHVTPSQPWVSRKKAA